MKPNALILLIFGSAIGYAIVQTVLYFSSEKPTTPEVSQQPEKKYQVGDILYTYKDVAVYHNGNDYVKSHGKHLSSDGYYYGRKWQCVEFVKRFFHQAHGHKMPNVWGHAKDFYQKTLPHGSLNTERGLLQFENGADCKPQVDDLLVWNEGNYGHVAIITEVNETSITVVQQNVLSRPTESFTLAENNGNWLIAGSTLPAGWLRIPNQ